MDEARVDLEHDGMRGSRNGASEADRSRATAQRAKHRIGGGVRVRMGSSLMDPKVSSQNFQN